MKLNAATRSDGFTMIEIMIVVTIIGLLLLMAIPNFLKNRQVAQKNSCLSNLRVIDTAKQLWGMETGKGDADEPSENEIVGAGLYLKQKPICPGGGTYSFNVIAEWPTCNFAGSPPHVYVEEP